jgi:hypothetical protein
VLLVNQSGSTGGSAHAITTPKVPLSEVRQRVMSVLQAEGNINTEVQKRGRINRTGQIFKPIYDYVFSAIPAEKRLMMMAKKKLKSLDANTTSNQKNSEALLSSDDFLNKYGDKLVVEYLRENPEVNEKLNDPLKMDEDGNPEITENAASKVSGRVAILPVEEQDHFYTEMIQKYQDHVSYLLQTGEYDLEVEYMNLEAQTLEKTMKIAGKGGSKSFGGNTYLEKCEVNILKKPFKHAELVQMIEKNTTEILEKFPDGISAELKKSLLVQEEQAVAKIDSKYTKLIENVPNEKECPPPVLRKENIDYVIKRTAELQQAQKIEIGKIKNNYESKYDILEEYLDYFEVGKPIKYPYGTDRVSAVSLGVKINPKAKNPFAPSAMIVRIAVANTLKYMELNMASEQSKILDQIMGISKLASSNTLQQWDGICEESSADRGIRYIYTGNLLQAFGGTCKDDKAKLISYSTADGSIKKGLLLPQTYAPTEASKTSVPLNIAAKCIRALGHNQSIIANNGLSFMRTNKGISIFTTGLSRQKYDKVLTNPELLEYIENNGGFQKISACWKGDIDDGNLEVVCKIIYELTNCSVGLYQNQLEMIKHLLHKGGNTQKFFWSMHGSLGEGAYFTPDKDYAMQFTGGNCGEMGDGVLYEVFLNIRNFGRGSIYGKKEYDGTQGKGAESDVYLATNPNQIKSATKNTGLFNPEKNSILNAPETEYKLNQKQNTMKITPQNLTRIYPTLDQAILPEHLQNDEYQAYVPLLEFYDDNEGIKETIDLFCSQLSESVENPATSDTEKFFEKPKKEVEKKEVVKKAVKPAKTKAEKVVIPKAKKAVKPEKPQATEIEKIPVDVAFIKRYVNFHKKSKTKKQVLDLLKSIQKAIAEKVLRKSDKYAKHIDQIQKKLTKCYRAMGNSIEIEINKKDLEVFKAIANSVVVSDDVKLFKAFLTFVSNPDTTSAKQILSKCPSPKNNLEKSVVRSLQNYIKNQTLNISDQELNGIYEAVGEIDDDNDNDDVLFGIQKKNNVQTANSVINSQDFAQMEFDTLPLTGVWKELLGTPSTNFTAMIFGSPGSGKTTLCISLSEYLCENHDKQVLFATIEEGINHTFQEKLKRMKAIHPNLHIANHLPENLDDYDVVFLDSVNTFKFDTKKLRSLRKDNPKTIFFEIFQTTKNGLFRGSQEYQHDCDVVIFVKDGIATTENQKNRFGANGTFKIY